MADKMTDALRKFAQTKKPATATPPTPPRVQPNTGVPPQTHMRTAYQCIEEFERKLDSARTIEDTSPLSLLLLDASSHIASARDQDPNAILTIDAKPEALEISLDFLACHAMYDQGHLDIVMARIIAEPLGKKSPEAQKLFNEAIEAFKKSIAYGDHSAAHRGMSAAYLELDQYAEARNEINRAIELDPHDTANLRFRDENTFTPPPPPPKEGMKLHYKLVIAGILCFFPGAVVVGSAVQSGGGFMAIIGIGLFIWAYFAWKKQDPYTQSQIPGSYQQFKDAQLDMKTKEAMHKIYSDRYNEEQRKKRDGR